jgi:membrane protein implicated in regulation of membrane protease activity
MFLTAYLAAFGFGVVLIGAAVLFGDGDHDAEKDFDFHGDVDVDVDVDVDADADMDHDHDVDHIAADVTHGLVRKRWLPFLSMRFWTYALGTGGATGTALTALGLASVIHVPVALGTGLVLGWTAAWSFRKLKQATADSTVRPATLKGASAKVVLAIRPGAIGKIRLHIQGQTIELLARSPETREIERHSTVLIVRVDENTAIVEPVRQLTTDKNSQGV